MVIKMNTNTKQKHQLALVYFFAILTLLGKFPKTSTTRAHYFAILRNTI